MSSASKTPNLNLPQWAANEKPERTDFNSAFDAIDELVNSGSNSNGIYVKFPDGTMLTSFAASLVYVTAYNLGVTWTFPAAFVSAPVVSITTNRIHPEKVTAPTLADVSATTATVRIVCSDAVFNSSSTGRAYCFAVGRWK